MFVIDFWEIIKYFDKEDENFNNICRHGLSTNTNKESLLAVCVHNIVDKTLHYCAFPLIKEEKWFIKAKTKYDIPQYIEGIPDGFAIFCTTWEAGKVRKYQEQLEKKKSKKKNKKHREVEDMDVINKKLNKKAMNNNNSIDDSKNSNEESDNEDLNEPVPKKENKFCHICNSKIKKYLEHIKSMEHIENLKKHKNNFNRFKITFENIVQFWDNKKKEQLNNAIIKEKLEKVNDINKNIKNENSIDEKMSLENNTISVVIMNNNSTNNIENDNIITNSGLSGKDNLNNIDNLNKNITNKNNTTNNNPINPNIKVEDIKENISNNIKLEEKLENNICSNINLNSFNLTYSTDNKTNNNSIFNINNIFSMNSNNNLYLNNSNNNNAIIKKIKENFNVSIRNKNKSIKEEKDIIKPLKKFATSSMQLFSTLSNHQFLKSKKRKRDEPEKTFEMFVVTTPKRIKYDRFPLLSRDNPKKLINNSILFFK